MADKNVLGSVIAIGAIGGVGYLLWKSMKKPVAASGGSGSQVPQATAYSPAGSGVLQVAPADTYPSNLNIDWSKVGGSAVGPIVGYGSSGSEVAATQTPLGPVSAPSWYGASFNGFGDVSADPRVAAWADLASMIAQCQGQIDAAWASYSGSLLNRLCAGAGFCPAYQNTADMVTSANQLASSLISLAQDLTVNPDALYEDGSKKSVVFQQIGSRFVGNASSIVTQLGDNSFTAAIKDFIVRIPQSIQDVLSYTVDTAGNIVKSLAWSGAETILILGAAAAAALFLLKKSGARVHAGPVQVG